MPKPLPHPSGLVTADVDSDGWMDAIVASGNDFQDSSGPIAVLYNPLRKREPWVSEHIDHYFRIAVADINRDNVLDVVATLYPPEANGGMPCSPSTVIAHVYISSARGLPPRPTQELTVDGCVAGSAAAFADVNGDGWLDLALGSMDLIQRKAVPQFIYLNRAGKLDTEHPLPYETHEELSSAIAFGDLNADGLVDLIVGSTGPQWATVFFGAFDAAGKPQIDSKGQTYTFGRDALIPLNLEVYSDKGGASWVLAVFNNRFCGTDVCPSPLVCFDSTLVKPRWQSPSAMWTGSKLVDLDGDGHSDLIAGSWTGDPRRPTAGPLLAFCSTGSSWSSSGELLAERRRFLTFDLAVADLDNSGLLSRTLEAVVPLEKKPRVTLTLPERLVQRVQQIRKNGLIVPQEDFTWVPGTQWVGFSPPLEATDLVAIDYITTNSPDIALTNLDSGDAIPILLHR